MNTHTPAISAAIAVLTFRGIAMLLIVTRLSLSTPLITTPLLPVSLKLHPKSLSPPSAFRNYHVCLGLFSFVLVLQCRPKGQLPDCVLCRRVAQSRRCSKSDWPSSLSTMSVESFQLVRFFLCVSALLKILTIDSFTRYVTVTAQLYTRPINASMDTVICGSQVPRCHVFELLSHPCFFSLYDQ